MFKLVKYDWMKRWKFFLAGLVVFVLVNVDIVSRIVSQNSPSLASAILIGVLFAMVVGLVFDQVGRMYKSLFTEEGQLLFTTPLSGYQILGGKMAAVVLECIAVALFVGIVAFIDYTIVVHAFPNIRITSNIHLNVGAAAIARLGMALLAYISFLLTIYLSMALAKSLFASVKYGKLLSFIFFIVITKIVGTLTNLFHLAAGYADLSNRGLNVSEYLLLNLCIIALLFTLTGYLLDRKINI